MGVKVSLKVTLGNLMVNSEIIRGYVKAINFDSR